jgi:hypothetical protein
MACEKHDNKLTVINSKSYAEKQIDIDKSFAGRIYKGSIGQIQEPSLLTKKLDELISKSEELNASKSDSSWVLVLKNWEEIRSSRLVSSVDSIASLIGTAQKWANLNINLLKFSGEVRFGDELEKMLYEPKIQVLSEKILKSVIYTHVYDQIFVNILAPSSLTHQHTTGGTIKLIQQTNYPESNEITLKCETSDVRYLDVFIRIPEWAVNPKVSHGNVKYVAHPGEYCQISRKWNDGDIIQVLLKN